MNFRCPACRAENSTGPNCRRCKADLSLLIDAETCRARHVALAMYALTSERFADAMEELTQAEKVRAGSDMQRLKACAYLLAGDYSAALNEYALARTAT